MKLRRLSVLVAFAVAGAAWTVTAAEPTVRLTRVPGHGLQPKAVLDHKGTLHLVYLAGDAGGSDVFYTRRNAGESEFAKPLRVNQTPGSAVAMGTRRGTVRTRRANTATVRRCFTRG